ncbi:MAG: M23 family metallopeptidase [Leptonema sp. (in: bacteria)]
MLSIFLIFFIIFFSIGSIFSQDKNFFCPIDQPNLSITSTFGESRKDHFHVGVDISKEDLYVFPIQSGKILYYEFEGMHSRRFLSGSGNQVWLDHGMGFWSGYFHLKKFFSPDKGIFINLKESFALTGNTGRSYGAHLHFFIFSDYGKKAVNPLSFVSCLEKDEVPPEIEYIAFLVPDGGQMKIQSVVPNIVQELRLKQKRPLYVKVIDYNNQKRIPRMPYKIEWFFENTLEVKHSFLTFDYLENTKEGFLLNGKYKFQDLYFKDLLYLDTFNYVNGENKITIIAYDYHNHSTKKTFYMFIKKEY